MKKIFFNWESEWSLNVLILYWVLEQSYSDFWWFVCFIFIIYIWAFVDMWEICYIMRRLCWTKLKTDRYRRKWESVCRIFLLVESSAYIGICPNSLDFESILGKEIKKPMLSFFTTFCLKQISAIAKFLPALRLPLGIIWCTAIVTHFHFRQILLDVFLFNKEIFPFLSWISSCCHPWQLA